MTKTYEITVTIYVQADTAKDALDYLSEEIDYICDQDNQLLAASYPNEKDIKEEFIKM